MSLIEAGRFFALSMYVMKSTSVLNGLPPMPCTYFTNVQCKLFTPEVSWLGQGTTRAKKSATDGASPMLGAG